MLFIQLPYLVLASTVHQGDLDGEKGVYHINAVDEVTQFRSWSRRDYFSEWI